MITEFPRFESSVPERCANHAFIPAIALILLVCMCVTGDSQGVRSIVRLRDLFHLQYCFYHLLYLVFVGRTVSCDSKS